MLPRRKVSCRYVGGTSGGEENSHLPAYRPAASATSTQTARRGNMRLRRDGGAGIVWVPDVAETGPEGSVTTDVREESMERLIRFKSARISAAVWHRMSRSLSSAFEIVSSSFGGSSGFRRIAPVGARFRMASVTTAEVSPRKGRAPVAIS